MSTGSGRKPGSRMGSMRREDRAKQFMPFAALKGYEEALRKKEQFTEPRIILGEDGAEMLDRKLRQVSEGDEVRIRHYWKHRYVEVEGRVMKLLAVQRKIRLNGGIEIKFDDIADIDVL